MAFGSAQRTGHVASRGAVVVAIAGLAILPASCSGRQPASTTEGDTAGPTITSPQTATPTAEPEPGDQPREVPEELRFRAPLLAGGTVRGAEFAGRRLAVWFWAPW